MPPEDDAAASLVPSPDEVTAVQNELLGALVCVHVTPEFEETNIRPFKPSLHATNFVPSAEQAIDRHQLLGALVMVQG